eukprot:6463237-Amphidinium_carterae.1
MLTWFGTPSWYPWGMVSQADERMRSDQWEIFAVIKKNVLQRVRCLKLSVWINQEIPIGMTRSVSPPRPHPLWFLHLRPPPPCQHPHATQPSGKCATVDWTTAGCPQQSPR